MSAVSEPIVSAPVDVLIVGAGPIGLACAIEAKRVGLTARVVEAGALVNSLIGYPTGMEFFSTPELLEIGGHPLATARYKPVREEVIDYYISVAMAEQLSIHLNESVVGLEGEKGAFSVKTSRECHQASTVVVATGFFGKPNLLGVPGEDVPNVVHYYKEPYRYAGQRVAVVGAKNSAAKAALDCHRHGASVTLVHRGADLAQSVKYWIRPDLENRIAEGSIATYFDSSVVRIHPDAIDLQTPSGEVRLPIDWVLAMTGYEPDFELLESLGITFESEDQVPVYDPETMETPRAGLYLAGTVCGGRDTSRWFIENGRIHAKRIAAHLTGAEPPEIEPKGQP